jgi:hypothetical protein
MSVPIKRSKRTAFPRLVALQTAAGNLHYLLDSYYPRRLHYESGPKPARIYLIIVRLHLAIINPADGSGSVQGLPWPGHTAHSCAFPTIQAHSIRVLLALTCLLGQTHVASSFSLLAPLRLVDTRAALRPGISVASAYAPYCEMGGKRMLVLDFDWTVGAISWSVL